MRGTADKLAPAFQLQNCTETAQRGSAHLKLFFPANLLTYAYNVCPVVFENYQVKKRITEIERDRSTGQQMSNVAVFTSTVQTFMGPSSGNLIVTLSALSI